MRGTQFGISYGDTLPSQPEFWRDETTYRMTGGFYLDDGNLNIGMIVDKGCPLEVNFATKKAKPCKGVRVISAAAAADTTIKVSKGSLIKVGDIIGDGTKKAEIKSIDNGNVAYDVLTLDAALGVDISVNAVLHECTNQSAKPRNKANALNYRRTHIDGSKLTVTAVGQAYEIFGDRLPNPCSEADKESLGDRFLFIS